MTSLTTTKKNTFSVESTSAVSVQRQWRTDLHMEDQVAIVDHYHRLAAHENCCEEYRHTCASKSSHTAFLHALVAEGLRYQEAHGLHTVKPNLKVLVSHIESEMDAKDQYPALISEIAGTRMFGPASPGKKRSLSAA